MHRRPARAGAAGLRRLLEALFPTSPRAPPVLRRRCRRRHGGSARSAGAHTRSRLPLLERPDRGGSPISARHRASLTAAITEAVGAKTTRRCPQGTCTDDRSHGFPSAPVLAACPTPAPGAPGTFSIRGAHVRPAQHPSSRRTLQPLAPHPREAPRQGRRAALPPPGRCRPLSARGSRPLDRLEPPAHHLRAGAHRRDLAEPLGRRGGARAALPVSGSRTARQRRSQETSATRTSTAAPGRSHATQPAALPAATRATLRALLSARRAALPSGPFASPLLAATLAATRPAAQRPCSGARSSHRTSLRPCPALVKIRADAAALEGSMRLRPCTPHALGRLCCACARWALISTARTCARRSCARDAHELMRQRRI